MRAGRRDERWLADVWRRQAFDRRRLRTTSGLGFKVVYPGLCTGHAGPDFRDAILALPGGDLLRGDVELHLESSGWREHGHHRDPAYDAVLLHVVLDEDQPTRNSAGQPVLTLELAGRLGPARIAESPPEPLPETERASQLSYVVAPCRASLPRKGPDAVRATILALAAERFESKQAGFEAELAACEPSQVLYAGLMEALGYSRNRQAFRQLAEDVPLSALAESREALAMEARLLAAAGALSWETVGVRPDNLPPRRIGQFAAVLGRLLPEGLPEALLPPLLELASPPSAAAVRELCHVWERQLAEVGAQRVAAIA
ncbi:MAG TPA: DUF2851 family protein, partial [Chloroflexota bacterium]